MHLIYFLGWLLISTASADVVSMEVAVCEGAAAADLCVLEDGTSGTCQPATCHRNDYSEGVPPRSVAYPCLKCTTGQNREARQATPVTGEEPATSSPGCAGRRAVSAAFILVLLGGLRRRMVPADPPTA